MVRKSAFYRLWIMLSPFHSQFKWLLVLLVLYEGILVVATYVVSFVIDLYGRNVDVEVWVGLFVGLVIYDELFMRLDNAIDWRVIARILYPTAKYLHTNAFTKFMGLDMKWHEDRNSGALVGKVNNGVDKTEELVSSMSWEFFPTAIQTLLTLVPLVYFSWPVAGIAVFTFPIFMYFSVRSKLERDPLREKRYDLYEEAWHVSIENVQAVETAVMFGQTDRLGREYSEIRDKVTELGTREARIGVYKYNRTMIRILSYARRLVLIILVVQLNSGLISVAGLVYVNTLMEKLFSSYWRFARLFDRAYESAEGVSRLVELMDETPEIVGGLRVGESLIPSINMREVCFSYNGKYSSEDGAIHNLSLDIEPGEVVALVGPSGAGKTTIRKLVARLLDINSGTIEVGGIDVKEWNSDALHRLFGYVPQGDDVHIFAKTIGENISFSYPEATHEEIVYAAEMAGIHDFITNELKDGYDTLVGEHGKRLSGGQKQRVALARAILADRPILVFDEATSAVDAITEHEIQERMKEILKGRTAIIIAHRLSTVWNIADKIVVMDRGEIVEQGSHEELMEKHGLYYEMASLQMH